MSDEGHIGTPDEWSYACQCIRCQWEQWWHEGDPSVIALPDEPHPDGEYREYWENREFWRGKHPNEGGAAE